MVRIAVDMDEVIADFVSKEIRLFNEANGTTYVKNDLAGKKLRELHPEQEESIRERVKDTRYFSDLPLIDGDKSIISADYLIDDHKHHLEDFQGQGILFAAPHNYYEEYPLKMNSWDEIYEYFVETYG